FRSVFTGMFAWKIPVIPFYKINDTDFYRFVLVCLLCFVHLKIDFLMLFRLHILHVYHISWQCFSVYLYLYFGFYFVQTQKPPPNVFTNSMVGEPIFYESIRRLIYALTRWKCIDLPFDE